MKTLTEIRSLADRPLAELARAVRQKGGRSAAVLCGLVPPEILHAAGALPMRLRATGHSSTDLGSTYFAQTHCSLVRHVLDMGLRGQLADFDAVLFATGCDHSRRMFDAWRHADAAPALRHLVSVSSDSTPAAVAALEHELRKLVEVLRKAWGVELGEEALRAAIALYNRQRRLLGELYELRRSDDCPLTGTDVLALHLTLSSIPVEEGNALLERLLQELPGARAEAAAAPVRLFLASSHFEDLKRMAVIEQFGGRVVHDLMCTGTGFFHGLVDEKKEPLSALSERGLRRLSCPHAADEIDRRFRFITESVRDWRCSGVVLDRLSFCAIGAAEAFVLRRRLRAQGVAVLELEGELHGGGEGQLRTRLEAFCEQLRNRSAA
jgi:benzoyl-CoA reductase/2-hydroxyglutaryl-CoA dehydratase subunit BcrC/BadD/HgdB